MYTIYIYIETLYVVHICTYYLYIYIYIHRKNEKNTNMYSDLMSLEVSGMMGVGL